MITILLIIIIITLVVAFILSLVFQSRRYKELASHERAEDESSLKLMREWMSESKAELAATRREMQQSLSQNKDSMQGRLDKTNKVISERLDSAAKVIGGVRDEIGQMKELGHQMKDLRDFLRSPKLRGNIGEQVLKDLLSQVLPNVNYAVQYKFKDGQVVDAVIKTDKGIIPIDSKFPMESYQRLAKADARVEKERCVSEFKRVLKKHIDDIAKKYILPEEGTFDFAVMYLPSESVYQEMVVNIPDIMRHAQEKRIIAVSPNTFYFFLQVVLKGLEGQRVEERAEKILRTLGALKQDAEQMGKNLSVLERHITNAQGSMGEVNKRFGKLTNRIESTRLLEE